MKRNIYSQRLPFIHESQGWTVESPEKTSGPVQAGLIGTQGKRFSILPGKQLLALECPLPSGLFLHFQVRSQTSQWLPWVPPDLAQPLLVPWAVSPLSSSGPLICILLRPSVLCILQTSSQPVSDSECKLRAGRSYSLPPPPQPFSSSGQVFWNPQAGFFSFHSEEGQRETRPQVTHRQRGAFLQGMDSFCRECVPLPCRSGGGQRGDKIVHGWKF